MIEGFAIYEPLGKNKGFRLIRKLRASTFSQAKSALFSSRKTIKYAKTNLVLGHTNEFGEFIKFGV